MCSAPLFTQRYWPWGVCSHCYHYIDRSWWGQPLYLYKDMPQYQLLVAVCNYAACNTVRQNRKWDEWDEVCHLRKGIRKEKVVDGRWLYTTFLSAPGLLWGLWSAGLAAVGLKATCFGSIEAMYTLYSSSGLVLALPAVVEEAEESFDLGWDASASSRLLRLLLRLWELWAVEHGTHQINEFF